MFLPLWEAQAYLPPIRRSRAENVANAGMIIRSQTPQSHPDFLYAAIQEAGSGARCCMTRFEEGARARAFFYVFLNAIYRKNRETNY